MAKLKTNVKRKPKKPSGWHTPAARRTTWWLTARQRALARRTLAPPLAIDFIPVDDRGLLLLLGRGAADQQREALAGDAAQRFPGGAGDMTVEFGLKHERDPLPEGVAK